jgi:glycosyltransferase involved in cell wall biosynthesis
MRILFFHPPIKERVTQLTLWNVYNSGGFSGTETSLLEICKYLHNQNKGFVLHVVGLSSTSYNDDDCGASFFTIDDFVRNKLFDNKYDWYIPLSGFDHPFHRGFLQHIHNNTLSTKVILWLHTFLYDATISELKSLLKNNLYAVFVSDWSTTHYVDTFDRSKQCVVQNGICPLVFKGETHNKERGQWCFHATFERGCAAGMRVFDKVREMLPNAATSYHILSYYKDDIVHHNALRERKNIHVHGSKPKMFVAELLRKSEYFVYPLVLPNNKVHHDTFACVILEALVMGVIVVL